MEHCIFQYPRWVLTSFSFYTLCLRFY
jgi:hypothetical protein